MIDKLVCKIYVESFMKFIMKLNFKNEQRFTEMIQDTVDIRCCK